MILAPPVGELVGMFVKHNPQTPRRLAETAGRLTAALGGAAAKLTVELQRELMAHQAELPGIIIAVVATLQSRGRMNGDGPVHEKVGEGIGEQLDHGEASRRLNAYIPLGRVEDWAGETAGPAEIERKYGIRRSTLHDWQKRHAAIGLLSGVRKHVFPIAQFIDSHPVPGLAHIVASAGAPRTAWRWLIEPHPSLHGRAPLDRLKQGDVARVTELVEADFGQS
jgi:hypothetical protein